MTFYSFYLLALCTVSFAFGSISFEKDINATADAVMNETEANLATFLDVVAVNITHILFVVDPFANQSTDALTNASKRFYWGYPGYGYYPGYYGGWGYGGYGYGGYGYGGYGYGGWGYPYYGGYGYGGFWKRSENATEKPNERFYKMYNDIRKDLYIGVQKRAIEDFKPAVIEILKNATETNEVHELHKRDGKFATVLQSAKNAASFIKTKVQGVIQAILNFILITWNKFWGLLKSKLKGFSGYLQNLFGRAFDGMKGSEAGAATEAASTSFGSKLKAIIGSAMSSKLAIITAAGTAVVALGWLLYRKVMHSICAKEIAQGKPFKHKACYEWAKDL